MALFKPYKVKSYKRLTEIFASVALIGALQSEPVFAQDVESVSDAISESVPDVGISSDVQSDVQDVLPAYLRFKPLAICHEAEENTPDDVKTLALDDDAFSSVQDWASGDQASLIMTYRLCREEDPTAMGDSVLIDVIRRISEQPWLPETIKSFLEEDPGLYFKILNFGYRIEGITLDVNGQSIGYGNYGNNEDSSLPITYSAAQLLASASDSQRAERILDGRHRYSDMDEHDDILRAAFNADPILMFKFPQTFNDVSGDQPLPENMGPFLMEAAADHERAKTLIKNYEFYMSLPTAADIVKTAINSAPTHFIAYISGRGRVNLHDDLNNNPDFFPDAQALIQASLERDVRGEHQYELIRYYELYAHLPEAEAIFTNAINTDPVEYFRTLANSSDLRNYLGDSPPMPSVESLLAMTSERLGAQRLIRYFDFYQDVQGAEDVVKAAINAQPAYFLEYAAGRGNDLVAQNPSFMPSAEILLQAAADEKNSHVFQMAYDLYADLPEAKDILRKSIEVAPVFYLRRLSEGRRLDQAIASDPDMFPTAAELIAEIDDWNAGEVMRYYDLYAHLPAAKDVLRKAIEVQPFTFLKYRERGEFSDSVMNDDSLFPDGDVFLSALEGNGNDNYNYRDTVQYAIDSYETYAHMPWAEAVLKEAVKQSPRNALESLMDRRRYRDQTEAEFDNAHNLAILTQVFEQKPDELSKQLKNLKESLYIFMTLARHNPELMDFMLQSLKDHENVSGAFHFLGHPENPERIEQLTVETQDKLLDMIRPALNENCNNASNYFMLLREGSWLIDSGHLTQDEIAFGIGCAFEYDTLYAIDLIEKNDKMTLNPDMLRNAILKRPAYFLEKTTRDEQAEDFVLNNVRIPYDDLLQAAQEYFAADELSSRNRYHAIKTVNNLHNYDNDTRFAVLRDMTPQNRVRLAGEGDEIYYTSSFNHIMADTLDTLSQDDQVRTWLFSEEAETDTYYTSDSLLLQITMNAMHFGKLEEFMAILTPDEVEIIAGKLMDKLAKSSDRYRSDRTAVLTTTILPILEYMSSIGYGVQVEQSIIDQYKNAEDSTLRNAMGALASLFSERQTISEDNRAFFEAADKGYADVLQNYMRDTLLTEDLFDDQGRNFQMMVFYDDRDGHNTFGHFKSIYQADKRWSYKNHAEYISFSRGGMTLYANKPQHEKSGNRAIEEHVAEMGGDISVLIHRGHSYHVENTAKQYLNEDVKFFWLGACRSSSIWRYIDEAPEMQFIYSQNVGTMLVNDPLLKNINDTLAKSDNVDWTQMRDDAYRLSNGDKRVKDYIFPDGSIEYGVRMTLALFEEDKNLSIAAENSLRAILSDEPQTEQTEQTEYVPISNVARRTDNARALTPSPFYP